VIRRFGILVWKEFLQHIWVFVGSSAVLSLLGVFRWLSASSDPLATSDMHAVAAVVLLFVPIVGAVLGHRVVVREYQGRTQLFLEALPLRRWEMVIGKYTFGLVTISSQVLVFVLGMALLMGETAPRFLLIVALRSLGYVASTWSLFFSMGLLGRLRVTGYLTLAFGFFLIQSTTAFEIDRFGPFALIDSHSFPYERSELPLRALLESALASLALLSLGLGIALTHEGSVAERLARRASPREVVTICVLLFAEAAGAVWLVDKQKLAAFEFSTSNVLKSPAGNAEIMYAWPALEPRAAVAAAALDQLGKRAASELGVVEYPAIRIAHNAVLARREVKEPSGHETSAVLLEVNLGAADFDLQHLTEYAAHAAFLRLSKQRAGFEPNHWLLDGFSSWWTSEREPATAELQWLRALVAARRVDLEAETVTRWDRLMEATGESGAHALGFSLADVLGARHGKDKLFELARAVIARPTVDDFTSWLTQRSSGPSARFVELTGETWPAFVAAWRRELSRRALQAPQAEVVTRILEDRAELRVEPSRVGADVVYTLAGPARVTDRECAVLGVKQRPFDQYVTPELAQRRLVKWPAGETRVEGRLRGQYQRGDRAWLAVECVVPELRSETRLRAVRFEVPR